MTTDIHCRLTQGVAAVTSQTLQKCSFLSLGVKVLIFFLGINDGTTTAVFHVIELWALKGLGAKVDAKLGLAVHTDRLQTVPSYLRDDDCEVTQVLWAPDIPPPTTPPSQPHPHALQLKKSTERTG